MESEKIFIGSVLQLNWDLRPIRIIGLDEFEIFYEIWLDEIKKWSFSSLNENYNFYRTSLKIAIENTTFLRCDPLSKNELSNYRPDLPLRFARSCKLNWISEKFTIIHLYEKISKSISPEFVESILGKNIFADSIALIPFGPKGAIKKEIVIYPSNNSRFSQFEILWQAQNIQASISNKEIKGVGLYRAGLIKGTPSYYLWGCHDRAGNPPDVLPY